MAEADSSQCSGPRAPKTTAAPGHAGFSDRPDHAPLRGLVPDRGAAHPARQAGDGCSQATSARLVAPSDINPRTQRRAQSAPRAWRHHHFAALRPLESQEAAPIILPASTHPNRVLTTPKARPAGLCRSQFFPMRGWTARSITPEQAPKISRRCDETASSARSRDR